MTNREQPRGSLAELLCALSFATGVGFGGRMDHGVKSAYIGLQIACALNLPVEEKEAIFYGALLKDVGCTACSAGVAAFFPDDELVPRQDFLLVDPSGLSDMAAWLNKNLPRDAHFAGRIARFWPFLIKCGPIVRESMRSHCEIAALFAQRLGFPDAVQRTLRLQWERWDGKGLAYGLSGTEIPVAARVLYPAQILELMCNFGGPSPALALAREKRGTQFDPVVIDAFLGVAEQCDFWKTLDHELAQDIILEMRPPTSAESTTEDQTESICEALADFTDIKSRQTWKHSRAVAEAAAGIGRCLGLEGAELTSLRCAALVHDLGKVAVPLGILEKGDKLSKSEWEMYRIHPYYTQRILELVAPLKRLAAAAAAHHEWIDGHGYHRQLSGEQIPLHGRILAVANTYTGLVQQGDKLEPGMALQKMRARVGTQFDASCYDALVASLAGSTGDKKSISRLRLPGSLTERESEVLRLLAQGQSNPQIARTLCLSKKTIEHHLTHIYRKIGVTCRTAAVVYVVRQGLI